MAWITPKTDWTANPKSPDPSDLNRIEGNIDFLKQDIETKKGLIVDAINDMNQPAEVTDTHAQLAGKIRDISKDADASVGNVLSGKTFYQGGGKKTGTMPNRAGDTEALAISRSGTTLKLRAPKGFYDGTDDNVTHTDVNDIAENIKEGITIRGVTGTCKQLALSAGDNEIAYVPGPVYGGIISIEKTFEWVINCAGTIRVSFSVHASAPDSLSHAQIYKNGSPVGIKRPLTSSPVVYTEDINVSAGDFLQIYSQGSPGGAAIFNYVYLKTGTTPFVTRNTV